MTDQTRRVQAEETGGRMPEVFEVLKELLDRGGRGALATVVRARGSTPRRAGAKTLVLSTGEIIGTVGGGCIEAAVQREAEKVWQEGVP